MRIPTEKFKQQLFVFFILSFLFQSILFFPVLMDSIHSYFLILDKNLALKGYISAGSLFFSFVVCYFFYWFICSYFLCIPGLLLSRWQFVSSVITVFIVFVFSFFSKLDFFIFNHYQFHFGSGISSWFIDKKYKFYINPNIFNDMSVSREELIFILSVSCLLLLFFIFAMLFSRFLAKRYSFKKYSIHVNGLLLSLCFGFFFYFQYCYQHNQQWQIAQVQRYPLFGLFANLMVKWKLWNLDNDIPIVVDLHSVNYQIKMPKIDLVKIQNKLNILWIVVDTQRKDVVTPQYMPFLSDYQKKNIQFTNHWSSGNSTQPGIFGMFYSLPENYFSSVVKHKTSPYIINLLKNQGYQLNVFYSNTSFNNPPFDKNLFVDFPEANKHLPSPAQHEDPDENLNHQLNQFLLSDHQQPFFTFVLYSSVHSYCEPQYFPLLLKNAPLECKRWNITADTDPKPLKLRYLNAVHHVDGLLKEVINNLKKANLEDNTIVIITADHGESFNEHHNNHWGHSSSFSSKELHVPMTIHWPGKAAQKIDYFTSHYDMAPTLLTELFHYQKDIHSYMLGHSLFVPHQDSKELMIVGSYFFMGALKQDKYYIFLPDGRIKTYDLNGMPILSDKISSEDLKRFMNRMNQYFKK
jgi:membrane-anchored protein YejM (alkaline phosphatase superfamily)